MQVQAPVMPLQLHYAIVSTRSAARCTVLTSFCSCSSSCWQAASRALFKDISSFTADAFTMAWSFSACKTTCKPWLHSVNGYKSDQPMFTETSGTRRRWTVLDETAQVHSNGAAGHQAYIVFKFRINKYIAGCASILTAEYLQACSPLWSA